MRLPRVSFSVFLSPSRAAVFLFPRSSFSLDFSFSLFPFFLFISAYNTRYIGTHPDAERRKINKTDARYRRSNIMALNERIGHSDGIFVTASRRLVCHITSHRLFPTRCTGPPRPRVQRNYAARCIIPSMRSRLSVSCTPISPSRVSVSKAKRTSLIRDDKGGEGFLDE